MPKKRKNLSHEEIWDDSALVQSWDEALEEYKLYHSIHARGENVEEVLRRLEQDQNGEAEADDMDTAVEDGRVGNGSSKERARPHGNGSLKWSGVDQHPDTKGPAPSEKENAGVNGLDHGDAASKNTQAACLQGQSQTTDQSGPATKGPHAGLLDATSMPNTLLDGPQDQALKHLLMSWYYAGYYTGLYQGQQQAQQNASH